MNKNAKILMVTSGIGLITVALAPTPDDVTVVSPVAQILIGVGLIYWGTR